MNSVREFVLTMLVAIIFFVGTLFTTGAIDGNLKINKVKLITDNQFIEDSIEQHQKDALYLPYKLRKILFNETVYIWQILRNIANFWSINNINQIMLLGNLYPIILGLRYFFTKKVYWPIGALVGVSFSIGINKMIDARSATLLILPVLAVLLVKGIQQVKHFGLYITLLIFSLLVVI